MPFKVMVTPLLKQNMSIIYRADWNLTTWDNVGLNIWCHSQEFIEVMYHLEKTLYYLAAPEVQSYWPSYTEYVQSYSRHVVFILISIIF